MVTEVKNICLGCGVENTSTADIYDEHNKPSEGDMTVCLTCGHAMAFNKDLTVRNLTDEESKFADSRDDIIFVREFIKKQRVRH